ELLARFEKPRGGDQGSLKRYTLRLGNARYPFMKFVVQEYLVDSEFFFSVDTHDDLDVRSDNPDYDAWVELKKHNLRLKKEIESAWARAGLPTHEDLRLLAEGIAEVEREPESAPREAADPARDRLLDRAQPRAARQRRPAQAVSARGPVRDAGAAPGAPAAEVAYGVRYGVRYPSPHQLPPASALPLNATGVE